ncbi:MAG: type II toxin-antitoxin system VapC family toxin [Geminicoccales bacterium]
MNGWLLDTNVIFEITRRNGDARVLRWMTGQPEHSFHISVLTLGEYDKGIHNLPTGSLLRMRTEADLRALESRFARRVLPVSDPIVRRWGRLSGEIQRTTGRAPAVVDTLLAATAIEHGLVLATRNVRDVQDTGARLFNPWQDDPESLSSA